MKAEERKVLETNTLADRMGKAVQRMKGGPDRRFVLVLVLAAVVGAVAFFYWQNRQLNLADQAKGWRDLDYYSQQPNPESGLAQVMQQNATTNAGSAARMQLLWRQINQTQRFLRADPVSTLEGLAKLESAMHSIKKDMKEDPVLSPELLHHIAVVQETRSVIDYLPAKIPAERALRRVDPGGQRGTLLKTAADTYGELVSKYKDSAYGKLAQERLDVLQDTKGLQKVGEFYQHMAVEMKLEMALQSKEVELSLTEGEARFKLGKQ